MEDIKKKNFDVWKVVSLVVLVSYALFLLYPLFLPINNDYYSQILHIQHLYFVNLY